MPTFAAYADEFKKTYVLANNKPSERSMKASILKHHLLPVFGEMRLDAIKMHAVETLKAALLANGLQRLRNGAPSATKGPRCSAYVDF